MAGWHKWIGTTGVWATAGNWSPAGPPGAGDDIGIPANITQDITVGPAAPLDFESFITAEQSTIDICNSGSPAKLAANLIDIRGRGDVYLSCDSGGVAYVVDRAIIRPSKTDAIVHLHSDDGGNAEWPDVMVLSGNVTINTNAGTWASLIVGQRGGPADAKVTLDASCGALAALRAYTSRGIISGAAITTAEIHRGVVMTQTDATIANAYVAGTLYYNLAGTITLLHALPGSVVDFTQVGYEVTITQLVRWPGSTVKYDEGLMTFTNPTVDMTT